MNIDEHTIEQMSRLVGVPIRQSELSLAAEALETMLSFARELDALDLAEAAPAATFDPSWSERDQS